MKLGVELDKDSLKDELQDNKELAVSLGVLGAAVLLFIFFVLPNLLDFPTKLSDRQVEVEEFNKIKDARDILELTDNAKLDGEVEVVSRTLPSDQAFVGIIGAISEAAVEANVQILSYKFSESPSSKRPRKKSDLSSKFDLEVVGRLDDMSRFSEELSRTYPISNIIEMESKKGITEMTVEFYYKPFTSVSSDDVTYAREKTAKEKEVYEEIEDWETFDFQDILIQRISTISAELF